MVQLRNHDFNSLFNSPDWISYTFTQAKPENLEARQDDDT